MKTKKRKNAARRNRDPKGQQEPTPSEKENTRPLANVEPNGNTDSAPLSQGHREPPTERRDRKGSAPHTLPRKRDTAMKKINAITMRLALTVIVCACVFKVSYSHIMHVAMHYGNTREDAMLFPVCIDAMILVSALYLAAKVGVSKMTKWYAKLGRYFGFAATIFCNISASNFESAMGVAVNLIPAIALIITMELLIHGSQKTAATRRK